MCADGDAPKRTVVLGLAVVCTLLYCTFDALVCLIILMQLSFLLFDYSFILSVLKLIMKK